jgi:hypothetical protein
MIELGAQLKVRHALKIAVVSKRSLRTECVPDSKVQAWTGLWILLFPPAYREQPEVVQIAEGLGIQSILHTDYTSTRAKLASFGLQNDERASNP